MSLQGGSTQEARPISMDLPGMQAQAKKTALTLWLELLDQILQQVDCRSCAGERGVPSLRLALTESDARREHDDGVDEGHVVDGVHVLPAVLWEVESVRQAGRSSSLNSLLQRLLELTTELCRL